MSGRKIIFFELNEVPYRIAEEYCRWRPTSNFARVFPRLRKYVTYAEDSKLSPWITWPSLHRGVSDAAHGIRYFGEDLRQRDQEFPPIWQILASQGVRTGLFGSLHSYPLPTDLASYAFYCPDIFAAGSECFPKKLSTFQELSLSMSRKSNRNVSSEVPWKMALRMLLSLPDLGFKFSTLCSTAGQLAAERFNSARRVRRRTYQVILAFDLFMKQLTREQPAFATFFTNHVASSMHRYWAAAFPKDYDAFGYSNEWVETYQHEILFTMDKFDAFLGRLLHFVDAHPEYVLWTASSMGQEATTAEPIESQLYLTDLTRFMTEIGLSAEDWSRQPAMEPDVAVRVRPGKCELMRTAVSKIVIEGEPLSVEEKENGFFNLHLGQQNLHHKECAAVFNGQALPFERLGMSVVKIDDMSNNNAYHIPAGTLFIYDPMDASAKGDATQISTLDVAPAIMKNYSIKVPHYMNAAVDLMCG